MKKILEKINNSIKLLVGRMIIDVITEKDNFQRLKLKAIGDDPVDGAFLFQHYGFSSKPLKGCEAITLNVNSDKKHVVVIATKDRRYNLVLVDGEVAMSTDEGDKIHFKRGKIIEIIAQTELDITSPLTKVTGKLKVIGDIEGTANIKDSVRTMAGDRGIYNGHTHPETGVTTGAPNQQE